MSSVKIWSPAGKKKREGKVISTSNIFPCLVLQHFVLYVMRAAEWWSTSEVPCPNLSRLAVRILDQCCSLTHFKTVLSPRAIA